MYDQSLPPVVVSILILPESQNRSICSHLSPSKGPFFVSFALYNVNQDIVTGIFLIISPSF